MHDAPLRQIIRVGVVLRHAVIPDRHVIFLPAPAHLKLRFGDVSKQEVQQSVALFRRQVDDPRGEAFIDEQRLPAADRVGAHHRMQQRRVFCTASCQR